MGLTYKQSSLALAHELSLEGGCVQGRWHLQQSKPINIYQAVEPAPLCCRSIASTTGAGARGALPCSQQGSVTTCRHSS